VSDDILFSVVMATYNRADLLVRAARSVLDQDHARVELLVVDDASTDDTATAVSSLGDSRVQYLRLEENGERGRARNVGVAAATGDYVGFLDSDDTLYAHHFATAARVIRAHGHPPWLHLGYDMREGESVVALVDDLEGDVRDRLVRVGNLFSIAGVVLRRDVAIAHPFIEDRRLAGFGEDYELWLRIAARYPVVADPTVTSTVHLHGGRSMKTASADELLDRSSAFLELALADEGIRMAFADRLPLLEANVHYFVATRIAALDGPPALAWRHVFHGVRASPRSVATGWFKSAAKQASARTIRAARRRRAGGGPAV
jgi:glycosyltransferase involved in cell wall biosynthesis